MIRMKLDLTQASATEKEAFLTLPHVAGAIDSLTHVPANYLNLELIVNNSEVDSSSFEITKPGAGDSVSVQGGD